MKIQSKNIYSGNANILRYHIYLGEKYNAERLGISTYISSNLQLSHFINVHVSIDKITFTDLTSFCEICTYFDLSRRLHRFADEFV